MALVEGRETFAMPCVYFVQSGDNGPIKIGKSDTGRVWSRVNMLQTGNPELLRIRRIVIDEGGTEATIHKILAEHRIRGEWFEPAERVLDFAKPCNPLSLRGATRTRPLRRNARAAKRERMVVLLAQEQRTISDIAGTVGITERSVRRILSATA